MSVREWIQAARAERMSPGELLPRLAEHVPRLFSAYAGEQPPADGNPGSIPLATATTNRGSELAVLFTDTELAGSAFAGRPVQAVPFSGAAALQRVLREHADGMILNPGTPFSLPLNPAITRLLFREYALVAARESGAAWVPTTSDGTLVALELRPGIPTVPVYFTREDAERQWGDRDGITAQNHPWTSIWERCAEVGADAAFLQQGYPEQLGLLRRQLSALCGDGRRHPLDVLEDEVARGGG